MASETNAQMIERLKGLHAKATPPPWTMTLLPPVGIVSTTRIPDAHWNGKHHHLGSLYTREDMELVAALRTHCAALIAAAEENERYRTALHEISTLGRMHSESLASLARQALGAQP